MISLRSKICLLLLFISFGLYSYELVLDFEPPEEEGTKVLAVIPFTGATMVDPELLKEFNDLFVKKFVKDNEYKVRSVSTWLNDKYKDNSFSSISSFLSSFKKGRMPVDKLIWGNINYLENKYILTFYWYDVKTQQKTMYQRIFSESKKSFIKFITKKRKTKLVNDIFDSIMYEFKLRNEDEKKLFNKHILIKKNQG